MTWVKISNCRDEIRYISYLLVIRKKMLASSIGRFLDLEN